jgi:uncharacterized protein YbjT (DUF2867 family)
VSGVLVTGANGFVGGELCRLLRGEDLRTVGAARRAPRAGGDGVKYAPVGDIGSDTDWSEAL